MNCMDVVILCQFCMLCVVVQLGLLMVVVGDFGFSFLVIYVQFCVLEDLLFVFLVICGVYGVFVLMDEGCVVLEVEVQIVVVLDMVVWCVMFL